MFKAGDRIRCILYTDLYTKRNGCKIGNIYIINKYEKHSDGNNIKIKEHNGRNWWVSIKDFELEFPCGYNVENKPEKTLSADHVINNIKPVDIVSLIDDDYIILKTNN